MTRIVHCDFETCSAADLKKTGSAVYADHPSTNVVCLAYAFDDEPVSVWTPGQEFPDDLRSHVAQGGEFHAFNVMFEFYIWNKVLSRIVPDLPALTLEQSHCVMALSTVWGLPLSLDKAAPAINAGFTKDKVGHALMMRMSKPRAFRADGTPRWWHEEDNAKLARLLEYCSRDVETERAIAKLLPPMPESERAIWLTDARMNLRGLMIDVPLVKALQVLTEASTKELSKRMSAITNGAVPNVTTVGKLTEWLRLQGLEVDSLAKGDMAELLKIPGLSAPVREAIIIRQSAAKTSTAKLKAMLACVGADSRVRGLVQYGGATRTLRNAGRLVQVQNLPRPMKGLDTDAVIDLVLSGADADTIEFVHGKPLDVVSSCLRPCFVAGPGKTFAVCDFSAIEARVIAWLAGQKDILKVFASGEDVYVFTANRIGSDDRQLGKVAVLGLGFGLGAVKFVDAAKTYGITLTDERALEVVTAWRKANSKIVSFWYDLERAARAAIENNTETQVGRCTVRMARGKLKGAMLITLPSGRHLIYHRARIEAVDGRMQVTYDGTNQYTRNWEAIRTYSGKLAENVTQAVARDLLVDAMDRMEKRGLQIVANIHDEVVCEVDEANGDLAFAEMKKIMQHGPDWADGLPLGGAGWVGKRYGKS